MMLVHLFLFLFQSSYVCPMKKDISNCITTSPNNTTTDLVACYVTPRQILSMWRNVLSLVVGVTQCDGVCIFAPVFWAEIRVRSAM